MPAVITGGLNPRGAMTAVFIPTRYGGFNGESNNPYPAFHHTISDEIVWTTPGKTFICYNTQQVFSSERKLFISYITSLQARSFECSYLVFIATPS